jgi:hypothetical protein
MTLVIVYISTKVVKPKFLAAFTPWLKETKAYKQAFAN